MKNSIIVIIFLLVATGVAFGGISTNEINKAIAGKKANWTAKSSGKVFIPGTSAPTDQEFKLGVIASGLRKSIPRKLDWHNQNGINYMSPVTNQGSCGSCVAFAAVATFEGQINIANQWPDLNMNFSEQHLFGCGGGRCNYGWTPSAGANYIAKNGIPDEACFPYVSGSDGEDRACNESCANAKDRSTKAKKTISVGGWFSNDNDTIEALQYGPILSRMSVYADFMDYESGIYQHVTGDMLGGHAVTIVGYDLDENYWIVKNSWDDDWGENGYFRIKMGDASNISASNRFEITPFEDVTDITDLEDMAVISGIYTVTIKSSDVQNKKVNLILSKDGNTRTFEATRMKGTSDYQIDLNTLEFTDGVYEIHTLAQFENSRYESQIKRVNIVNNEPIMDPGITSPANDATLSGVVEVVLNLRSEPLPVLKAIFHIRRPDGTVQEIPFKNPAPRTVVRWNTAKRPNGNYQIWVESIIGNFSKNSNRLSLTLTN